MKRKIAGLLAALMVLSVGTTAFAASTDTEDIVTPVSVEGVAVSAVKAPAGLIKEVVKVKDDVAATAKAEADKTEGASLLAVMDIVTNYEPGKPVEITFSVEGINEGDNIQVLHFTNGEWEKVDVSSVGKGTVTAKFTSLSPVAIVKLPATNNGGTDGNKAPATGSTAPVAAVLAMICLAGVAVCGKKVKFNA